MKRRVFVLGGTGFIGSRIVAELRRRPDVRMMVLGHRRVDYRSLEDVDLLVGSLTRFEGSWLERFQPDVIIHAARLGGSGRLRRRIAAERGRRANQRLVEWLVANSPETRVVYVSGTLVYGDRGEAEVDEDAPLAPTAFARQYIRAEHPFMEAQRTAALPVTLVRPPWVVGAGSWLHAHYVRPARSGGAVPMYGGGANWMSLVDVDDCAGIVVHLALQAAPPATVNVFAPGQRVRQRDFVEELAGMLRVGVRAVELVGRGAIRDRATEEALTSSLRATTRHADALRGYEWRLPCWRAMLTRYVSPA